MARAGHGVSLFLALALVASACGGSDGSNEGGGQSEAVGTGVLTVDGVDHAFEVFTCDLDGYENEGVEFDFDVAGVGSKDDRTYQVFARRSYHADNDWWVETIDLDYQDGGEGLHTLHGFSAAEAEPFIFTVGSVGVEVVEPVLFVADLVDEKPAGQGTLVVACP